MDRVITTNEASVRECVVSVKTVRLDKRQMTLSVFRQIPVVEYRNLGSAVPWGWVNYWHDKLEEGERPALFAREGILVRAVLCDRGDFFVDAKQGAKWDAAETVREKLEPKLKVIIDFDIPMRLADVDIVPQEEDHEDFDQGRIERQFVARYKKIEGRYLARADKEIKQYGTLLDLLDELGQLYIAT